MRTGRAVRAGVEAGTRRSAGGSCGSYLLVAALVFLMALNTRIAAQAPAEARVEWWPERPTQGALFRVVIVPGDGLPMAGAMGTAAGEALHFSHRADGTLRALAAVPVDATTDLKLQLTLLYADGTRQFLRSSVPVQAGEYRVEKLTVPPRFATPDTATEARIRREQERALDVSTASHYTPRVWDGRVVQPRETRITSGFGNGREFNGRIQSRHMGTDFTGAAGSAVRAAARGVVAVVDTFYLAGRVIYLDHGEGLVSAYFHLSRQDVVEGDTVQAGQVIGAVGATGRVTGPHLHWVVRYGAITVNPLSLLAVAAADSAAVVTSGVR